MNTIKAGWIGLGKMGIPMSRNLVQAGCPLTVYNRSKEKEAALKALGAATAATPADLIKQSDVVFIMVSDDAAVREIFTGSQGLLGTSAGAKIIVNMSTVSPGISREMAALCRQEGNDYLDAPVSGSVKQAEERQLVIMAGGEAPVLERVKPLLETLGRLILPVGGHGAGNTAKLAINTLLGIQAQALAEAVVFARRHGIRTEDLLTLIHNSALGNVFLKIKGDAILQDNYQAAFALKHIAKDLRLARDEGLDSPLGETAFRTFQQAEAAFGEEDIIAVIRQIEQA